MNVLWVCNLCPANIAPQIGLPVRASGGWLSSLLEHICAQEEVRVTVGFPNVTIMEGEASGIRYFSFPWNTQNQQAFEKRLQDIQPDVIHIWGTEYRHSLDMTNAAQACGMLDRLAINIQGLVSVIGKYHYFAHIPPEICCSYTLSEYRNRKCNMFYDRSLFLHDGDNEVAALAKVQHVVGRTEWDKACTSQINPSVQYHHINETLRKSFYENQWSYDDCEKHSLFIPFNYASFKGLHLALQAMPLILQQFPQAHLYLPGDAPKKAKTLLEKYHQRTYPKYLSQLMDEHRLWERVTFLGNLSEEEMCRRYLRSNAFASPSSIENSSNSVGEAMLLGMPVVASDVGGMKDFIDHNKEGYLYPSDAPYMLAYYVCKIFAMGKEAEALGKAAQSRAKAIFDRDKNMADMMELYHQLANANVAAVDAGV